LTFFAHHIVKTLPAESVNELLQGTPSELLNYVLSNFTKFFKKEKLKTNKDYYMKGVADLNTKAIVKKYGL
jgi:hypothetical protein